MIMAPALRRKVPAKRFGGSGAVGIGENYHHALKGRVLV